MSNAFSLGLVNAAAQKTFDVLGSSIQGAAARADTLTNFPKILGQMGASGEDAGKAMNILKKGVEGLPTTLQDVAKTTQSFMSATGGDAVKAAKLTNALNDAFLASGASGADAARGVQQLTQMFNAGKVDMMSWRTVMETMPASINAVAKSFGKANPQELYTALQEGEISMQQFMDRMIEMDDGLDGFHNKALTASKGIQTSFTNMKNAVTNSIAQMLMDLGAADFMDGFTKGFKKGLADLTKMLKSAGSAIGNFIKKMTGGKTPKWLDNFPEKLGQALPFIAAGTIALSGLAKVGGLLGKIKLPHFGKATKGLSGAAAPVDQLKKSLSALAKMTGLGVAAAGIGVLAMGVSKLASQPIGNIAAATVAIGLLGLAIAGAGLLAQNAIGGLLALGGAALGLTILVNSLAQLASLPWQNVAIAAGIIGLLGLAIVGLGALTMLVLPGVLAFGAAVAMVGVGIGVAAAGIGLMAAGIGAMADGISNLIASLSTFNPAPLLQMTEQLSKLNGLGLIAVGAGLAMVGVGIAGIGAGIALSGGNFAGAMQSLATGLKAITDAKFDGAGTGATLLGFAMGLMALNLAGLTTLITAAGLKQLAPALKAIKESKFDGVGTGATFTAFAPGLAALNAAGMTSAVTGTGLQTIATALKQLKNVGKMDDTIQTIKDLTPALEGLSNAVGNTGTQLGMIVSSLGAMTAGFAGVNAAILSVGISLAVITMGFQMTSAAATNLTMVMAMVGVTAGMAGSFAGASVGSWQALTQAMTETGRRAMNVGRYLTGAGTEAGRSGALAASGARGWYTLANAAESAANRVANAAERIVSSSGRAASAKNRMAANMLMFTQPQLMALNTVNQTANPTAGVIPTQRPVEVNSQQANQTPSQLSANITLAMPWDKKATRYVTPLITKQQEENSTRRR